MEIALAVSLNLPHVTFLPAARNKAVRCKAWLGSFSQVGYQPQRDTTDNRSGNRLSRGLLGQHVNVLSLNGFVVGGCVALLESIGVIELRGQTVGGHSTPNRLAVNLERRPLY